MYKSNTVQAPPKHPNPRALKSPSHLCRLLCYPHGTGMGREGGKDHGEVLPQAGEAAGRPRAPGTAGSARPRGQSRSGRMGGNLGTGGESHQSHSFPREKDKGQLSQRQWHGPTASGHAFYNRREILGKYFDIIPPIPKERFFLSKADEQMKNCSPVPQAANSPLIPGTATVSSISLGGTTRNDSVAGSHEAEIHLPNFRFSHYCKDDLSLCKSTRCMWNFILGLCGISYHKYVEFHSRYMGNFIPVVCGISSTSLLVLRKTWKQCTFISAVYTEKKKKVPEITKSWGCESRKYVGKFPSQSRKQSAGKAGIKHLLLQQRIKEKQNLVYSSWGTCSKCRAYPCRCCGPGKSPLHSSPGTGLGAMPEGRNRRCSEWPEVPGTWSMKRDKLIKKQSTQNWNIPFLLLESGVADYSLLQL